MLIISTRTLTSVIVSGCVTLNYVTKYLDNELINKLKCRNLVYIYIYLELQYYGSYYVSQICVTDIQTNLIIKRKYVTQNSFNITEPVIL